MSLYIEYDIMELYCYTDLLSNAKKCSGRYVTSGIVPFNFIKCTLKCNLCNVDLQTTCKCVEKYAVCYTPNTSEGLTKDVGIVSAFIIVSIAVLILVMKG